MVRHSHEKIAYDEEYAEVEAAEAEEAQRLAKLPKVKKKRVSRSRSKKHLAKKDPLIGATGKFTGLIIDKETRLENERVERVVKVINYRREKAKKGEDPGVNVTITVQSAGYYAGDFAKILVNDELVIMEPNENNHFRGLHIVIINPENGNIEFAEVFDTHETSDNLNQLIASIIPRGQIVVAAVRDDAFAKLSVFARSWF